MGTVNLAHERDLLLHEIRWTLEPGPPIDFDEPLDIELDDIDLDSISSNPLAPSLVAVLRCNRRLSHRLTHTAELIKTMLAFIRDQQLTIERLERQIRVWRHERRSA